MTTVYRKCNNCGSEGINENGFTYLGDGFRNAGYKYNYKLLDASRMGVPQKRERVFFYGIRNDLAKYIKKEDLFGNVPHLDLQFNEKSISINTFLETVGKKDTQNYSSSRFGDVMLKTHRPAQTIATINRYWIDKNNLISNKTLLKIGSYPLDYNFANTQPIYLVGMSVPPVMTAQIAHRIKEQWLDNLN